jgi:hypothetical protein
VATKPEPASNPENEAQDTYIENRDPTEMAMCFILAAAYLGLAKYCWAPLWAAKNLKLFFNVEGFFITIALISILVGLRPYISPSSMQISHRGIKYRGPYWPQRRSVTWDQVIKVYLSSELIFILYKPKLDSKRMWAMLIASVYLASRENIVASMENYCTKPLEIVTNPALYSRILIGLLFFIAVIWILEMLMN